VRRRAFITLLGGATIAFPLAAIAEQRMRRVGMLNNNVASDTFYQQYVAGFVETLRNLGWEEGRNLRLDVRWNGGDASLARSYAAELVALSPDVIFSASTTNLMALQQVTQTIPIVFAQVSDPVAQGFVPSLIRPGGNLTGFTNFEFSIGGKWVELLKQVAPDLSRVAVMSNPDTSPQTKYFLQAIETAAASLGLQVVVTPVRSIADIEAAIENFARQPNGGLILPTDSFTSLHRKLIADSANRFRLPAISGVSDNFLSVGGLLYYGSVFGLGEQYQQAAAYVDRILKGAKPGDLPVQLTTSFRFGINLKTAKAMGIAVPIPLLGRADVVIE
jgi:putative ABC transport system substrate-binding protein